nr:immunoglobulin heavy chain junction region [Mus musculus]
CVRYDDYDDAMDYW